MAWCRGVLPCLHVWFGEIYVSCLSHTSTNTNFFPKPHASAGVRGENTPERNFVSTGSRTYNHQVMSFMVQSDWPNCTHNIHLAYKAITGVCNAQLLTMHDKVTCVLRFHSMSNEK